MKKASLVCVLIFAAASAHADLLLSPGESGYQFLAMPISARTVSLGAGLSGDAGSISVYEHNPASLAALDQNQFSFTRSLLYQGSNLTAFTIGVKSPSFPVGFAIQYRRFGDSDVERDSSGYELDRDVDLSDNGFSGGFGYQFGRHFSVGYSVEYVRRNFYEYSAIAVTHGLGVQYYSNSKRNVFGVSLQNLGKPIILSEAEEEMPAVFRVGGSHRWNRSSLAQDTNFSLPRITALWEIRQFRDSKKPSGSVGAEWRLSRFFLVRGAGAYREDFSITGGIGIQWQFMQLDYGVQNREEAGISHTMSVVLTWGVTEDDDF